MKWFTKLFFCLSAVLIGSLSLGFDVFAKDPKLTIKDPSYAVRYVSQSIPDPIEIEAGATRTVEFKFKNVGTATWKSTGSNFVSAYTVEPKYRTSVFKGSNWIAKDQTAKISGTVKPGETGTLVLELKAPETTGTYKEEFHLASEYYTWVKGGYFFADIKVVPKKQVTPPATSDDVTATPVVQTTLRAQKMLQSKKSIEAKGGEEIKLVLGFKNSGQKSWNTYKFIANTPVSVASGKSVTFADSSWKNGSVIVERSTPVQVDGLARESFVIRAPEVKGSYTFNVSLQADDTSVDGGLVQIPVLVTADAPADYTPPTFDQTRETTTYRLLSEPKIRIGLWQPEESVSFISSQDNYIVYDGAEEKGILEKGTIATLSYLSGVYAFSGGDTQFTTQNSIWLRPQNDPRAVFELKNFNRTISSHKGHIFNKYRGSLEYVVGKNDKKIWVVNETLLEDYTKGMAETGNTSPYEYQKALQTAARTYAFTMVQCKCKYGIFDVLPTTVDQLFLGYVQEVLAPNVVRATDETRGYMVTYQNEIVITPYSARTNGTTLPWHEVWGGKPKPWLMPVIATYDIRDKVSKWGHGVGMAQRDALIRAEEEGVDWQSLLKYYYTGIEIQPIYQ